MEEMTKEEKKECREKLYTRDHMMDFTACDGDGDCDKCELSYDYVIGYNDGYADGYDDGY